MWMRLAAAAVALSLAASSAAQADPAAMPGGAYQITYRLELPHLESWAVEKSARICLAEADQRAGAMLPILSDNTPFAACSARNLSRDGPSLSYDIACPGRDSARAHAAYTLTPDGFRGRVAMTMGAKNMTMTEVQSARRLGICGLASAAAE